MKYLLVQGRLVLLAYQQIVATTFKDRVRNRHLATHRINRHHDLVQEDLGDKVWNGSQLVLLVIDLALGEAWTSIFGLGAHQMERLAGLASPNRLVVDVDRQSKIASSRPSIASPDGRRRPSRR